MAQKWVSFEEVKSRVSMRDLLTHYGLMQGTQEKPSRRGMELRLRCPFHEDKTPSLSINAETGKYHCFGCHAKGGDIIDFVVAKEEIAAGDRTKSRRQASLLIQDWFGVGLDSGHPPAQPAAAENSLPVEDVTPPHEATAEQVNPPLTFAFNSTLKFFQVDITGMFRMTSCARYFKAGVGSSRPNWRWIMCFVERPKTNTSCKALVKRWSLS